MGKKWTEKRRILAGFISMAIAASFLSAMIVLADNSPTVHFDGLELRMVAEYETDEYGQYILGTDQKPIPILDKNGQQVQSVQALVSVSISGTDKNTGIGIPLHYNEDYLIPSDWKTNGAIASIGGVDNGSTDPLHHYFFRVDEGLYAGKDPFEWKSAINGMDSASTLNINHNTDILNIHLAVGRYLEIPTTGENKIRTLEWEVRGKKDTDNYIGYDESGKTTLGTISFRVNETYLNDGNGTTEENLQANLKKLVDKFNGSTTGGPVDPSDPTAPLLSTYTDATAASGAEKLQMWYLYSRRIGVAYQRVAVDKEIEYRINVESEDVIIKARPVKDEVVINAYEAFTNGEISDLALAMQKYAESVRVTYVSEKEADMSIYWGDPVVDPSSDNMPEDGPGMFIQKVGDNAVYRFTWDPTNRTRYTFEEKQPDGSFAPVDPTTIYDPRGGDYMISQYFTYMENSGIPGTGNGTTNVVLKTYQTPIKVHLTVTPVLAVDAVVDKDSLTYLNDIDIVPRTYSELELADEARIVLEPTLSGVDPTVPVAWLPGTLDRNVIGFPGTGNPEPVAKWPFREPEFSNKSGIGEYTFNSQVENKNATGTGVQDRYPWLTTDPWLNEGNNYREPLVSKRYIVDTDNTELASRYTAWAEPYETPLGDEIGRLRVTIARRNEDNTDFEDMASGYKFRLYMPNGVEILMDSSQWFGPSSGTNVWSDNATKAYYGVEGPVGLILSEGKSAYIVTISPGLLGATDTYARERESLRRYINLGGWFGVKVQAPGETGWTDLIPMFSEPRTNIYTNSYDDLDQPHFDYTGLRAGLMPFYIGSDLPTFVTLPADDSVATRYDPADGHQPGELRQFKVDSWNNVTGSAGHVTPTWDPGEIVTYGKDLFARSHEYGNFGKVINPDSASGYVVNDREVKIGVQVQEKGDPAEDPEKKWDLLLTYEQTGDNITYVHNTAANVDEVKRVTFESKQEGYTAQQIVTLTLTNTGTEEIRGLYVDVPTLNGASGPYFTIISAPAVNLPAGAKTTFQISYVQNLSKGVYENIDATIPVGIHHNNGDKDFEAVLRITESRLHKVTLVVHPDSPTEGRVMGDANLVIGVDTDTTTNTDSYDGDIAGSVYEENQVFWVLTTPKDEYSILTLKDKEGIARPQVYYIEDYTEDDGSPAQRKVYLNEYLPQGPNPDFGTTPTPSFQVEGNERLFWLPMPNQSVTVHVHYYEPLLSKLRLSDLHAYAWDQKNEAVWVDNPPDPPKWQDSFDSATNWWKYEKKLHEPQSGNYNVITFDPKKDEYIVILDDEDTGGDNWCGVSVTLRALQTHISGVEPDFINQDIFPNVVMKLDDGPGTLVGGEPLVGDTIGPTVHRSGVFEAPTEKSAVNGIAQKTVIITISYNGTDLVPPEGLEERVYKVRFVRKGTGEARKVLLAGNSPYGMIENDETIIDKAAAKAAFDVENRFAVGYTPNQATELTNIYWPEAWGNGVNYDKDETALFVYLGQEFYDPGAINIYNNAGDLIDGILVKRSLTDYYQMDMNATAAIDRFSNGAMSTTAIELGEVWATAGAIPGDSVTITNGDSTTTTYDGMVSAFADVKDIRPGIYRLTYTFEDYDHTTMLYFTRPVIVLSSNGDVNADLSLTTAVKDADGIRKRFSTALPTELADAVYKEADRLVYQYRIVDANNDRNINNVDANLIQKVTALLFPSEPLTQFYRPTEYTYPVKP